MILVFSGSSGSGKNAIAERLGLFIVCSATTRIPRKGELMGDQYIFVSDEEFNQLIEEDAFAEYKVYIGNGHKYGTLKESIEPYIHSGEDACTIVEIQGMRALKQLYGDSVISFYIHASQETCEERMRERGDSEESIIERRSVWEIENKTSHEYDFIINNEHDIESAIQMVEDLLWVRKRKFDKPDIVSHTGHIA